jgi:hypothetical protein
MGVLTRLTILAPLLAGAVTGVASAQDVVGLSPGNVGQVFCIAMMGYDEGPIAGLLTPDLGAAIALAQARNAEIAARAPDEKPPLGDGIPWKSWPDSPSSCTVTGTVYMMDESRVRIHYSFEGASEVDYTDTLALKLLPQSNGLKAWRIDNVIHEVGSDLTTSLLSAFGN